MIVKAVLALIQYLADFIFSLIPAIPVLPPFVGQALAFVSNLMVGAAGILKWLVTDLVYNACIDFIVLQYGFKLFLVIFNLIKRFVLMKGD